MEHPDKTIEVQTRKKEIILKYGLFKIFLFISLPPLLVGAIAPAFYVLNNLPDGGED